MSWPTIDESDRIPFRASAGGSPRPSNVGDCVQCHTEIIEHQGPPAKLCSTCEKKEKKCHV
jgi:hypothetical protein